MCRIGTLVSLAALSIGLAACAHAPATPPPLPHSEPFAITETTSHVAPAPAARSDVHVSDDIARECKIDVDNVDTAPKFDFDRSDLRAGDRSVLQQVAACVMTGPLKGRSLHLVGRADPRGEIEYNFVLGESRAGSVRSYLAELGVASAKVTTTSRGKLDATGTDDPSWQRDRRVDVDLQP